MSSTNVVEIKHALRKIEFPDCAHEAIKRIEILINGRSPTIKQMDLAIDLMAEFIFWEKDRRGNKRSTELTCLQEMQLLNVLCEYFQDPGTDATKNTVFLSLFGLNTLQNRCKILCKLVSLGISVSCAPLLIAAGVWVQQLGCTSDYTLQLTRSLVKDYFALVPNILPTIKKLPSIAPQFTANFLTAVAEMYLNEKNLFTPPPHCLLETITHWISDNPSLCLAAQQSPAALPMGAIAMPAITPIAGLFKWCILAPLHYASFNRSKLNSNENLNDTIQIYAQLHFALLESVLETKSSSGLPNVVSAQHLGVIIPSIQKQINELTKNGKNFEATNFIHMSLTRLAQAVQVSCATRCMYGNIQELICQLEELPHNRLLKIVIETNKHSPL